MTTDMTPARRYEDMYAALDLLTDKLNRQVIKHKEKLRDHHKKDKHKYI